MAVGSYCLERGPVETAAAFQIRIANLAVGGDLFGVEGIDAATTLSGMSYQVPTFTFHGTGLTGGANDLLAVVVDRAAGEIMGVALGAAGTHTGFLARCVAAMTAAAMTANGVPFWMFWSPPTFIMISNVPGAGNALEMQGVDNGDPTLGVDNDPGGWTTGVLGTAAGKPGTMLFLGN